nr:MAG TPA: hypothetical protein [Caudoviricetes sp.]
MITIKNSPSDTNLVLEGLNLFTLFFFICF